MGWKKYNKETDEWEDNPRADELWEEYLKIQNSEYSACDWNCASDEVKQRYAGSVVRRLVVEWYTDKVQELMPLLYNARHVREWQILKDMGY